MLAFRSSGWLPTLLPVLHALKSGEALSQKTLGRADERVAFTSSMPREWELHRNGGERDEL